MSRWFRLWRVDAQEHQTQWFTLGGALFVGGLVVVTDWLFSVLSASPRRHLAFLQAPLIICAAIMIVGIYVMLASYVKKLILPGKGRVRDAEERRRAAETYLAALHLVGTQLLRNGVPQDAEIKNWASAVSEYLSAAWGTHEAVTILVAIRTSSQATLVSNVVDQLTGLIQRCGLLTVKDDFNREDGSAWKEYIDSQIKAIETSASDSP